ncbi:MAG: hypothetical protein IJD18_02180 [Clostridia bacterium]|nr:hypothetical protein [Clostridia bacterium]
MGKGIIDLYPKETYFSPGVRAMWKEYKKLFKVDLDALFGENYAVKLRFGEFFRKVIDGNYRTALNFLRNYKQNFVSESDCKAYDIFQTFCLNHKQMGSVVPGDWVKDDHGSIYFVVSGNLEKAVLKRAFTMKLEFVTTLAEYNYFRMETTDLDGYRIPTKQELATIKSFFKSNPSARNQLTAFTTKFVETCNTLQQNGFVPTQTSGMFYKYVTSETAFVVNVRDYGTHLGVVYGFTTTSHDKEYKQYFEHNGKDDDDITLRQIATFCTEQEQLQANKCIQQFFQQYAHLNKTELLAVSKEKRKAFFGCINDLLKPLQLKKKGNTWSAVVNNAVTLRVYLDKSTYSDVYRIYLFVNSVENSARTCSNKNYAYKNCYTLNWQLVDMQDLQLFLQQTLVQDVISIMNLPASKWTAKASDGWYFICDKTRCNNCGLR